jgi:acetoin utilization protein AcuB
MLVKDIMTQNTITVESDTYVLDAERIMESHRIGRLPVVDNGKLVGIITKDDVLKASPSSTSPSNQRQMFYLISKLTVKEIMKTTVVTIAGEATVEKAVAVAQKNRIGSLPVMEGERMIGILTTNDVFYKVLNPLLGIGDTGTRIKIEGAGEGTRFLEVMGRIINAGVDVKTFWVPPQQEQKNLVVHFHSQDVADLVSDLRSAGYAVTVRDFGG